jgi:1-acyl-sn-glycerol-3-phosphate acyltransferase
MPEIYKLTLSFSLVRRYIVFTFKRYYSEFIVIGKENIPTDSPLIFAPNHINAIMDALAVHAIVPQNLPLVFLARADIFRNQIVAKLLRYAKIMPAFRMRDGIENLGRNNEIFEQCVEILHNNKALGIMPEGNQEVERKLRPIVKGIFRIAFAAQKKNGKQPYVKIIPIGIDYGGITKSNKPIIVNIGKPIEVSEYMESYAINSVVATNEIKDKLRDELSNLTLNLATEKYYECFDKTVNVTNSFVLKELNLNDNTFNRFVARQKIAERLVNMEQNEPTKIDKLSSLCVEYERYLSDFKLSTNVFESEYNNFRLILEGVILSLFLPVLLVGLIMNALPFYIPVIIRKYVLKAQFIGFFSSLQFALGIITFPVFYILQTCLFALFVTTNWWLILIFLFAQYPLGKLGLKIYKKTRKLIGKLNYQRLRNTKTSEIDRMKSIRSQIFELVSSSKFSI